jgi:ribose 5-phosphate isomerase B
MSMKLMIGNDHAGYALKQYIVNHLSLRRDICAVDAGAYSEERVMYPYYAAKVAKAVASGAVDRGILICATGLGISITANRYAGVRAALCTSTYMGKMSRAHNDSNILCLGGRITGYLEALDILDAWLDTAYDGGRHEASLGILNRIDRGESVEIDN